MAGLAKMSHLVNLLLLIGLCTPVVVQAKHVSIKNSLGSGKNITLHCQSKDDDLGNRNVAYGNEFSWDFSDNIAGTTLFFCDLGWERVQKFHFNAYYFHRDFVRCEAECSWLVSAEGIYGLNNQTGLWEFIYNWLN